VRWKEPQQIDSVDPPINRTAEEGLTPFPFIFLSSLSLSHVRRKDLATALLPRPSVQLPTPARLVLPPPLRAVLLSHMRVKTLCNIRSTTNPNSEIAAEGASIPDPLAAWVRSTMTKVKIQALVDCGLL
jgi:hypothetical protein